MTVDGVTPVLYQSWLVPALEAVTTDCVRTSRMFELVMVVKPLATVTTAIATP